MTLVPGPYSRFADIQDPVVRYEWDDWKTIPALEVPEGDFEARLERISQRAVLAFECGTAEWIVYRFGALDNDPAPWAFLEAAWAMTIHPRYSGYGQGPGWQHYAATGWDGPVRRPIKKALDRLEMSIEHLASEYRADPSTAAALLWALASHVIPKTGQYERWAEAILLRFETMYARDSEDPLGDPVPREATDPQYDFRVGDTEALINGFLSSLDYRTNMFLSTPDGMLESFEGEADFIGTPYRFDLTADRVARRQIPGTIN